MAVLAFVALSLSTPAEANGDFIFAKQFGGVDDDIGRGIALDSDGNVYTTGLFQQTVDFDPGPGTFNLTSSFGSTFISKLDSAGNFVWAKQLGGTSSQLGSPTAFAITVDASGNVYTTGSLPGTGDFDFDPGPGTFNLTGGGIFVSKLDTAGNFVWAKQLGGTSSGGRGFSIALDTTGNVYTTGNFSGTVDFDPGPGTFNLTSSFGEIFISKLDTAGNFIWAKQLGGTTSNQGGFAITVDAAGNVYTTGEFSNTGDFDPGPGVFNLTSAGGSEDIFISKLDSAGNFVWARGFGDTTLFDSGDGITVDTTGNVYTTGTFNGTIDFDPGPGVFNLTSAGTVNIFISKLDTAGNFVWAKRLGGTVGDGGKAIALDTTGNVYTTGSFQGTVDFDPGPGVFNLPGVGPAAFVSKLDNAGSFVWAKRLGLGAFGIGFSIVVDAGDNVYTTGIFSGTGDFDPGPETFYLTGAGNQDIFVSKLGPVPVEPEPVNAPLHRWAMLIAILCLAGLASFTFRRRRVA